MNYAALNASNGSGEPARATVQAPGRSIGSTSIPVNASTNWPSGTFIATTGTLLSTGLLDPTTVQVFYGTASGTTVTITSFASGYTDKGNVVGDVVVIKPTTEWANNAGTFIKNITGGSVASAVNHLQLADSTATNPLTISAVGTDTNIGITLSPKGTGAIKGVVDHLYNPYKFSVYRNAAWSQAGGEQVTNFDAKEFDTGSNVDIVTHVGRFTAPIAGFYCFSSVVTFNLTTGDLIYAYLYKNGTTPIKTGQAVTSSTNGVSTSVSAPLVQLAANDYIEVYTHNGSGVSKTGSTGINLTWFTGFLVSAT